MLNDLDVPGRPVEVVQPEILDVFNSHAQPGHHQKDRVIPFAVGISPVYRRKKASDVLGPPGARDLGTVRLPQPRHLVG